MYTENTLVLHMCIVSKGNKFTYNSKIYITRLPDHEDSNGAGCARSLWDLPSWFFVEHNVPLIFYETALGE